MDVFFVAFLDFMGVDSVSAIGYHVIVTGINLWEQITTMAWERSVSFHGYSEKETSYRN